MTRLLPALIAILMLAPGCDPCDAYCEEACACADDATEACATTCLDTMDVYSGAYRADECADRSDALRDTCEEAR